MVVQIAWLPEGVAGERGSRAVTRDRLRGCGRGEAACPSLESLFVPVFEGAEVELILSSTMDMQREGHFLLLH